MKAVFLIFLMAIGISCNSETAYPEGKRLYEVHCSGCHGKKGEGLESLIPPLAAADMLIQAGPGAACWIVKGLEGKIKVNGVEFENSMPANKNLSPTDITNILNYIHNSWGNQRKFITLDEVKSILNNCN